jgi:HSP20 family molecular chaperone IbpA
MATLVRCEPFREIATLQNEMSRFMNGLLEDNGRASQAWVPALDLWETESEIVYAVDLPGVPEDEISASSTTAR